MRSGSVGAVILAAGGSSRLGRPKQLLIHKGRPLVRRVADAAEFADLHPTVIVAGNEFALIQETLEGTSTYLFHHRDWERGIGSTIRFGIERLIGVAPNTAAIVLLACDQPFVTSSVLRDLVTTWRTEAVDAAACGYSETVGVPAIFDRSLLPLLLALDESHGAKTVLTSLRERLAIVSFPDGSVDIDRPEDWQLYQRGGRLV